MKFSLRSRCLATSALLTVAGVTPAYAQTNPEEIVVTARRVEERLQDVPISISVFNQQELADRNIVSAGDLATYTPSLTTNSRFGAESTTFAIRGFTQEGATSPSVAVYFADVVAPRANGGTTSGNGAGPGAFFDLQNVQVLKGPQGTLFGRNTTGGAVLLTPQKPTDVFEGFVEGSLGNYDLRRIQAVINAPLGDNARLRIGVDHQERDGFLHNVSDIGPKDFADVNYVAARASLVVDLTPDLENYMIVSYSNSDTNGFYPKLYTSNFVPGRTSARTIAAVNAQLAATSGNFYDVENSFPNPYQKIEQWSIINTSTWRASEGLTIKNIASYAEFRQASGANIFGDYAVSSQDPLTVWTIGLATQAAPGSHNAQQSTFTEELQFQGVALNKRLTYQFGGYLEISDPLGGFQKTVSAQNLDCSDILAYQCTDLSGRLTGQEGRVGQINESSSKYRFRNLAIYGQATYEITDTLSITGGIRYTSDKTTGVSQSLRANFFQPNVPTWLCSIPSPITQGGTSAQVRNDTSLCNFRREAKSSKPTWLIDLDYKPVRDVLLYAKYARGYRQGGVSVSAYGLETWGPEKVDTYEIGAKTSFNSFVRGSFNIAAFYNDFADQQLQLTGVNCSQAELITNPAQCPFVASVSAGIGNAGKSRIQGVEIDATLKPFSGLDVSVGYAYLDTKLTSATLPPTPLGFSSILSRAIVGGPLPMTPKNKYTISANYALPIADSLGRLSIGGTFTHQDSSFGSAASPAGMQYLPPQDNLNINVNWMSVAGSPVDLSLFATNVTKEKYFVTLVGGSFGYDSAILNQPRMYGVRLRYSFGR